MLNRAKRPNLSHGLIVLGGFFVLACAHGPTANDACQPRLRALIDSGSGSFKLNLSEVSECNHEVRLIRVLDEQTRIEVPLQSGKDATGALSESIQLQALAALTQLRERAIALARVQTPQYKFIEFAAVGTHAVRTASNVGEFSDRVHALGFNLTALTQAQEGEFAFAGVKLKGLPESCQGHPPLVWDVGGGSMQLTAQKDGTTYQVQGVGVGTESFRDRLIANLGPGHAPASCKVQESTPNPIGWKNSPRAEKLAAQLAEQVFAPTFTIDAQRQCVIGVGGVHTRAIAAQLRKFWPQVKSCICPSDLNCVAHTMEYTRQELSCLALFLSDKSDCDPALKGDYSTTAVSSLYLILGFMDYLKLLQIHTVDVNMGTSLITDTSLLKWSTLPIPPAP